MNRSLLLLSVLLSVGCQKGTPTAAPSESSEPRHRKAAAKTTPKPAADVDTGALDQQPKPAPRAEDAKVRAFKEKVRQYLAEARAGAKLLTLAPSPDQVKAKADHITDLYTHLPDVPPEVDATGDVAQRLKNINGTFAFAEVVVGLREKSAKLGSRELMEKNTAELKKAADLVNQYAAEIEAKAEL